MFIEDEIDKVSICSKGKYYDFVDAEEYNDEISRLSYIIAEKSQENCELQDKIDELVEEIDYIAKHTKICDDNELLGKLKKYKYNIPFLMNSSEKMIESNHKSNQTYNEIGKKIDYFENIVNEIINFIEENSSENTKFNIMYNCFGKKYFSVQIHDKNNILIFRKFINKLTSKYGLNNTEFQSNNYIIRWKFTLE